MSAKGTTFGIPKSFLEARSSKEEWESNSEMELVFNRLGNVMCRHHIAEAFIDFPLPLFVSARQFVKLCQCALVEALKSIPVDPPNYREIAANISSLRKSVANFRSLLNKLDPDLAVRLENSHTEEYYPQGKWTETKQRRPLPSRLERLDDECKWFEISLGPLAEILAERRNPPRWKNNAERNRRIVFAVECIPVFERSYLKTATLNSWPKSDGASHSSPWKEFFTAMNRIAFGEASFPDIEGVLDTARRRYISNRGLTHKQNNNEYRP